MMPASSALSLRLKSLAFLPSNTAPPSERRGCCRRNSACSDTAGRSVSYRSTFPASVPSRFPEPCGRPIFPRSLNSPDRRPGNRCFHQLHRKRRAALTEALGLQIFQRRFREPRDVEARMLEETRILDRDEGVDQRSQAYRHKVMFFRAGRRPAQ